MAKVPASIRSNHGGARTTVCDRRSYAYEIATPGIKYGVAMTNRVRLGTVTCGWRLLFDHSGSE